MESQHTPAAIATATFMDEEKRIAFWKADKLFAIAHSLNLLDRSVEAYQFEKEARNLLIEAGVEKASTFEMAAWAAGVCADYEAGRITTCR
jgi:predicted MarR family transcription regulator